MDVTKSLAIVTGVSKGIGLAVTQALLQAGARVAGWSRSPMVLQHPRFRFYQTDVRHVESVEKAYQQTVSDFGTAPTILINNAGLGYEAKAEDLSLDQWRDMFDTNVNGLFYATRVALPAMKKAGEAHIVNISSVAGTTGIPGMAGYCATKYAVRGFSNALFKEVRADGVKVTCIYPGSVNTHFFDRIDSVTASDQMMDPADVAATILHCLQSPANYLPVDIEIRPLKLKG